MAKINPDKKQVEYWQGRNEKMFLDGEKDILEYSSSLKKQYTNASKRIEGEIEKFYGKFAVDNNYTMTDLKKLLNKEELKSFKESITDIADYAKEHQFDKDYQKNIKLLRLKSRISRLEELKTKIEFQVQNLYENVNTSLGDKLEETFEDGYYKTIFNNQKFLGFSDNFAMLNTKAIERAVTTPYMVENYSQTLWKQKDNLMNILNQQVPQGIILGYNPTKLAREVVSKRVDKQYYNNAVRLIRTEYNLILNDATAQGYLESGIDRYQILATLDSRTSDICRDMDGEIFKVKEKEVGVNYPPFHPNCRTTTIPYFESDEFDTEIEQYIKDEDGIKHKITDDTQYEEWKNALKKNKDGTAVYENNNINTDELHPASLVGVKLGKEMSLEEAGGKNVNPNFEKDNSYNTNCQSCVVTYEARRRGYNVQALPNLYKLDPNNLDFTKYTLQNELAEDMTLAWFKPGTLERPEVEELTANSVKNMYDKLDKKVLSGNRYEISIRWKSQDSSHIMCIYKNKDNILEIYDPQNGEIYTGASINAWRLNYARIKGKYPIKLMRVDNLVIDERTAEYLMEAKK